MLCVDLDERWNELSCFSKVRASCLSTNRKKCAHHRNPHNTNIQTLNFIGTQPTNQVMPILPIHHSTAKSSGWGRGEERGAKKHWTAFERGAGGLGMEDS